jgi:hypothetical protein
VPWTKQNTWPLIPRRVMYVCVAGHSCKPKVVQICSLVCLCLKINPPGNKLNYSFFSKHVRPHPHIQNCS